MSGIKFRLLNDIHLFRKLYRLVSALRTLQDVDILLVASDLADRGTAEEYQLLRMVFDEYPEDILVFIVLGNSLKALDLGSFIDMSYMFLECSNLEMVNLDSFDTAKVTNMRSMFADCSSLEALNLSSFDTSEATNMSEMFYKCSSLKTLDVSGFDTANVLQALQGLLKTRRPCKMHPQKNPVCG